MDMFIFFIASPAELCLTPDLKCHVLVTSPAVSCAYLVHLPDTIHCMAWHAWLWNSVEKCFFFPMCGKLGLEAIVHYPYGEVLYRFGIVLTRCKFLFLLISYQFFSTFSFEWQLTKVWSMQRAWHSAGTLTEDVMQSQREALLGRAWASPTWSVKRRWCLLVCDPPPKTPKPDNPTTRQPGVWELEADATVPKCVSKF